MSAADLRTADRAAQTAAARYRPEIKMAAGAAVLLICLGGSSLAAGGITLVAMGVVARFRTGTRWREYLRHLLVPAAFLLVGILTILVEKHPPGHPLFWQIAAGSGGVWGIGQEALIRGLRLLVRSLSAWSAVLLVVLSTPVPDMLAVLQRLKVPGVLISLMVLMHRYLFVLNGEQEKIRTAQRARLGYGNRRMALRHAGQLAGTVLVRSLERSDRIFSAMEARLYRDGIPVLARPYRTSGALAAGAVGFCILLMAVTFLERGMLP